MTISWNNVSGAETYVIYWGNHAGVNRTAGNKIGNVSSPYIHSGLVNGTSHYYVLTAGDRTSESIESAQVSGVPAGVPAPPAPANLTAVPGDGQVTVSWNTVWLCIKCSAKMKAMI